MKFVFLFILMIFSGSAVAQNVESCFKEKFKIKMDSVMTLCDENYGDQQIVLEVLCFESSLDSFQIMIYAEDHFSGFGLAGYCRLNDDIVAFYGHKPLIKILTDLENLETKLPIDFNVDTTYMSVDHDVLFWMYQMDSLNGTINYKHNGRLPK